MQMTLAPIIQVSREISAANAKAHSLNNRPSPLWGCHAAVQQVKICTIGIHYGDVGAMRQLSCLSVCARGYSVAR
jgi:hypothetical protein